MLGRGVWKDAARSTATAIAAAVVIMLATSPAAMAEAPSGPPITIGFSMPLTGGLAVNGTSGLLAMQIWAEDTNKRGGLLGRPVKLVYYDDQTNPSLVPGIYTKLLDVDKVDLVISAYGTNVTAPALPVVIQHNMTFMGLFAMDVNEEFRYPKYFSMLPVGPDPRAAISEGFFEIVKANKDKLGLKTIALAVDDGEATRNTADGARVNLKKAGLDVVYDKTYPPTTTDFTPIVRAMQATNPDVVYIASYPPDSVGLIRAMHEIGLNTKVCCGTMTGPQSTSIKTSLGPMLNGIITFDFWLPAPTLRFPGVMEFLQRYQEQAAGKGVDPLGLSGALGLRRSASPGRGCRADQKPRPGQDRRLHAHPHLHDRHRRCRIRRKGRVEESAPDDHPVPGHHQHQSRRFPRRQGRGRAVARPVQSRRADPALFVGQALIAAITPARLGHGRSLRAGGSSANRGARRWAGAAETICCRAAPVPGSGRGG